MTVITYTQATIQKRGRNFRCALRSYLQLSRYYGAPCIIPLSAVIRQHYPFLLHPEVVPMASVTRYNVLL